MIVMMIMMTSTSTWTPGRAWRRAQCCQESSLEQQQRGLSHVTCLPFVNQDIIVPRKWKIKVGQIPCDSMTNPRFGCLQYHTATTGTVTYDCLNIFWKREDNAGQILQLPCWPRQLSPPCQPEVQVDLEADHKERISTSCAKLMFRTCVRRAEKYCAIAWSQCSDTDAFKVCKHMGPTPHQSPSCRSADQQLTSSPPPATRAAAATPSRYSGAAITDRWRFIIKY